MKFKAFLEQKVEYSTRIDRFRAFSLYHKYKKDLKLKPIIHIIGTNGKGSTGRFLAQLLYKLGFKVGHFTSPHIFEFNERFWLDQKILDDKTLQKAHERLSEIFQSDLERLSYFEYATFLAVIVFKKCDFVIFEAGLGGEFDSTSLFEKRLSIFTKIGFDHTQILGNKLEMIARTKLKVMAKKAVIANEQEELVLQLSQKIALLKKAKLFYANELLDTNLLKASKAYAQKHKLPSFLEHNLNLALAALRVLQNKTQAFHVIKKLQKLDLRGRCEQISENIFVDVGHNELAARALLEKFKGQKLCLIYNSFLDKDIFAILRITKPIIDKIMIYKYESQRELATKHIKEVALKLDIKCEDFIKLEKDRTYLVFGSFVLVQHFLKEHFETA
ncbi:bifunctional folylpolyglutamate synthase/dihydrofolate synthase [Campylobacter sp. MIT 12-8780]|uniref:Mur ligase family protein n=1 Tax=unclassified Campylobacter TaxID=2593542 RepID=UPI00115E8BB2|nr:MULTISPECIES: Mur ligase family protein [unclassified Campylobacter]NDJ27792.1 bifunctional folylpolyglutamate synthase/dihydrofolate synthase [Campylobacter sp. MIT 19-121]TQR41006.1 bifunctional folylpolyglutamate synthase/dihydrofolate synthase [Campylobacter sp. MIT 12-8780]